MRYHHICIVFLLLIGTACKTKPQHTVKLSVDHTKNTVNVTGLSELATLSLKHDSVAIETWQSLLIVCKMPVDTELMSAAPIQPGKYRLINKGISFMPDTAFVKGVTYFARYYRFDDATNETNIVTEHRSPGETPYTQLIFKY